MNWWQSFILGIVEGITEYLPVSSTGHLLITQELLGIGNTESSKAFAICIQAGAILAVLALYYRRVQQMIAGILGKDVAGLRLAINIIVAFMPAVVVGLLLEKKIKEYLFGPWPIIAAWFIGGVAILAVGWYRRATRGPAAEGREVEDLTWKMALIIGSAQCIAMWPGTSRSLVTIVAGLLVGLRLGAAVEFSFLLGVLTLSAATAHDALKHGKEMIESYGIGVMAIGFVAAWISAMLAVKWMVGYLNKHGLAVFGYYRIAIAVIVAALVLFGVVSPHVTP